MMESDKFDLLALSRDRAEREHCRCIGSRTLSDPSFLVMRSAKNRAFGTHRRRGSSGKS